MVGDEEVRVVSSRLDRLIDIVVAGRLVGRIKRVIGRLSLERLSKGGRSFDWSSQLLLIEADDGKEASFQSGT